MSAALARSATCSVAGAARTSRVAAARPTVSARLPVRKTACPAPTSKVTKAATQAAPMEIAQLAGEASFITGTALTMCAITLVGLAVGFVLLRVESLVEEGKL